LNDVVFAAAGLDARREPGHALSGDLLPRYPITGTAGCCALAASGHAATASSVMNSRRFM
jgi:hypothetical protein